MRTDIMLKKLARRFPKRIAKENHDFVGLMQGKLPSEVHRILLCLDFDDEVYPEAANFHPDLIITHHPFIFGRRSEVLRYDEIKRDLCARMDTLGVPVYSFHTNFDTGNGGMNDALAAALRLTDVRAPEKNPMMRIGNLPEEMEVHDFAEYARKAFGIEYGLLVARGRKTVSRVGIIGGGGSRSWRIARDEGCDIYLSGDAPHYVRRDVVLSHYNYLDFPHEIEKIFMPTMKKLLLEMDPSLDIVIVDHETRPEVIQ